MANTAPTTALTAYSLIPAGIMGGLATVILSNRLKGKKEVDTGSLIMACAIASGAILFALYLIKSK